MEERPHFIPPRKRQSGRKLTSGITSHGDHIMTVQGQITTDSSQYQEIDEDIKINSSNTSRYKSIADRPKLELPINLDNEIYTVDSSHHINSVENSIKHKSHEHKDINVSPVSENLSDTNKTNINYSRQTKNIEESFKYKYDTDINLSPIIENTSQFTNSDNSLELSSLKFKSVKKRVNIQTENETSLEHISLKQNSETDLNSYSSNDNYLTMTGTIKRGRKQGQNINVQLNISREQLEILESNIVTSKNICICNLKSGIHVLIWSLICLPFVTLISALYSFYIGTLTWYNVFVYINEEKSYLVRLFLTPILVLLYPFTITLCTLGLGIYAGFIQLSIYWPSWFKEVSDIEKGFYGWLCNFLKLSDCSPYEVVVLTDLRDVKMNDTKNVSVDTVNELSI